MTPAATALDAIHRAIADHLIRESGFKGAKLSDAVRNGMLHVLIRLQIGRDYTHAQWLLGGPDLDAKIARFTDAVTDPGTRRDLATAIETLLHPTPTARAA